jgi:hypothetical protein
MMHGPGHESRVTVPRARTGPAGVTVTVAGRTVTSGRGPVTMTVTVAREPGRHWHRDAAIASSVFTQ